MHGFDIDRFQDIFSIHMRKQRDYEGVWKGFFYGGQEQYFLHYPMYLIIPRALSKMQPLRSIANICGYFSAFVNRKTQYEEVKFRDFIKKELPDVFGI